MKFFASVVTGMLLGFSLSSTAAEIAIVPFDMESVDTATAVTINELFFESLQSFGMTDIATVSPISPCREKSCAFALADSVKAQQVIFGSARRLGSKWIVRSFHYKAGDEKPLSSHTLDCKSIEDFEPVMKRLAEAIVKGKSTEEVTSIDNVTETETDETRFQRREGFYSYGFQFGYLYPTRSSSYVLWGYNSSDYPYEYEQHQLQQVLSTDFVNWFELPRNLTLQWDLHVGWGAEVGTHLLMLKQFGKGDYSPYVGGGAGINYCFNGDPAENIDRDKRNSGFTLIGKGGILLLRTYSFHINIDGGYKYILNDDRDQGAYANFGIMWRKQPKSAVVQRHTPQNPLFMAMAGIGGVVSVLLLIGLVGAASSMN